MTTSAAMAGRSDRSARTICWRWVRVAMAAGPGSTGSMVAGTVTGTPPSRSLLIR
jgi:hypothetical protein